MQNPAEGAVLSAAKRGIWPRNANGGMISTLSRPTELIMKA